MEIIRYHYPEKPNSAKNLAVALGYFDGVHSAHRKLLAMLTKKAKSKNLTPCVFTFANAPSKSKKTQTTIYNINDKLKFFENIGIETVILADFDSISSLSPYAFVNDVLIDALDVHFAICGYNFKFGNRAAGSADDLINMMAARGKEALCLKKVTLDGKTVSSTAIRELIGNKKIKEATELLGIPYFIRATVEKGLGLGTGFGFPTVNTSVRSDSPLSPGVYRTAVKIGEKLYTGITNVGTCPTVKEREVHAETLIVDFCGDIYGEEIQIFFLDFLREEKLFSSVEELREQIYKDREISIRENGDLKWLATGLNLL
jgi:riboflavin kinase/FMN adenylyltransferase